MIITITMSRKRGRKDNTEGLHELYKGGIQDLLSVNKNLLSENENLEAELNKLKEAHRLARNEIRDLKGHVNTLKTEVKDKEEQRLGEFKAFTDEINKLSKEKLKLRKEAVSECEQKLHLYNKMVFVMSLALRSGEVITEMVNQQPDLRPAFAEAKKAIEEMREERMRAVPTPQTET